MRTLNLDEAATLLGIHKETLRKYTSAKIIPGCKPGKSWRFIEEDLLMYMRSLYGNSVETQANYFNRNRSKWPSSKETKYGGLTFPTKVNEYEKALGLQKN